MCTPEAAIVPVKIPILLRHIDFRCSRLQKKLNHGVVKRPGAEKIVSKTINYAKLDVALILYFDAKTS